MVKVLEAFAVLESYWRLPPTVGDVALLLGVTKARAYSLIQRELDRGHIQAGPKAQPRRFRLSEAGWAQYLDDRVVEVPDLGAVA